MFVQDVIVRGTTATHEFSVPYNADEIKTLHIAYGQNNKIILSRDKSSAQVSDRNITVSLSQQDTLGFMPEKNIKVEIKLLLNDGQVLSNAEAPVYIRVIDSMIEEELS